ncbi:MAG: hypothetical protein WCK63_18405, partial [Betaproteobacteria bacterium]
NWGKAIYWYQQSRKLGYVKGQELIQCHSNSASRSDIHTAATAENDSSESEGTAPWMDSPKDHSGENREEEPQPSYLHRNEGEDSMESSDNALVENSSTRPTTPSTGDGNFKLVNRSKTLGQSRYALVSRLTEIGVTEEQLNRLVTNLSTIESTTQGLPVQRETRQLLEAMFSSLSDNDVLQISYKYDREQQFLREAIQLREFVEVLSGQYNITTTYEKAKIILDQFGQDGAICRLMDVGASNRGVGRLVRAIEGANNAGYSVDSYIKYYYR